MYIYVILFESTSFTKVLEAIKKLYVMFFVINK